MPVTIPWYSSCAACGKPSTKAEFGNFCSSKCMDRALPRVPQCKSLDPSTLSNRCLLPDGHALKHRGPNGRTWVDLQLTDKELAALADTPVPPVEHPRCQTPCAVCKKPCNSPNPNAVFCSAGCAQQSASVRPAAERLLSFLCGLNLQDHSVKEQREALIRIRELQTALRPEKVGK